MARQNLNTGLYQWLLVWNRHDRWGRSFASLDILRPVFPIPVSEANALTDGRAYEDEDVHVGY